jgi:hypothetical protein
VDVRPLPGRLVELTVEVVPDLDPETTSWTRLAGGLPNELFGRSNVSIAHVKPERI